MFENLWWTLDMHKSPPKISFIKVHPSFLSLPSVTDILGFLALSASSVSDSSFLKIANNSSLPFIV